jgi:hypothetical protein
MCILKHVGNTVLYVCTWVSGGEIEVGKVDHIVVALLLLVEESDLRRPAHHVIRNHALQSMTGIKISK